MSLKTKQYITLTPSAWQTLDKIAECEFHLCPSVVNYSFFGMNARSLLQERAKEQGVSERELIERWARE